MEDFTPVAVMRDGKVPAPDHLGRAYPVQTRLKGSIQEEFPKATLYACSRLIVAHGVERKGICVPVVHGFSPLVFLGASS